MKELGWVIGTTAVFSFIGGVISGLASAPVWVGAVVGAAIPLLVFLGAILAMLGLVQIIEDYLKGGSR